MTYSYEDKVNLALKDENRSGNYQQIKPKSRNPALVRLYVPDSGYKMKLPVLYKVLITPMGPVRVGGCSIYRTQRSIDLMLSITNSGYVRIRVPHPDLN